MNKKKEKWANSKTMKDIQYLISDKEDNNKMTSLIQFNDAEGANLIYYVLREKWIYQVGLVEKEVGIITKERRYIFTQFWKKLIWHD